MCAAARQLGPSLKARADHPSLINKKVTTTAYSMNKEETIEILCRETSAALKEGKLGSEEVWRTGGHV